MRREPASVDDYQRALDGLPVKVSAPVRALLDADMIDERAVVSALNVARSPGEHHRLLYYLLIIRGLRDKRVPVDDTISMAVSRGRRIRLNWSIARWKDEHNRLSRMETLERLSAERCLYDLSAYRAHLPDAWPGYLIGNSRRLGMEGLRQRHCVAGYHARIRAGNCAIAVVFQDHLRWTVELYQTGDPAQPVYARQVKGRYNRIPNPDALKEIYRALGLPERYMAPSNRRGTAPDRRRALSEHYLRLALAPLRERGVAEVYVTFDGSGDSGAIECLSYLSADGEDISTAVTDVQVHAPALSYTQRRSQDLDLDSLPTAPRSIDDILNDAIYEYLETTGVDWYNEDGGYGKFTIDVEQGQFEAEVNARYTKTSMEHFEAYDLIAQTQTEV